jgi:hypothetical protein
VLWRGALTELVPEGARWVIVARPAELVRAPAARRVIAAIVPDERLERYRQHTGIDVRQLEGLVWAELDLGEAGEGTLLAIRGPFSAPLAVAEMGHRMLPIESSSEEPWVRRVGYLGGARRDLVAIGENVLLAILGPPSVAARILERARGVDTAPSALAVPGIRSLYAAHAAAPLVLVVPRPLELPPSGIGLLLARERALAASVVPSSEDELAFSVDFRGEFPPGAGANFRAFVESLAESDLGVAIGIRDALGSLTVQVEDERAVLEATVPAAVMAAGLRVLFGAEIAELVDPPRAGSGPDSRMRP